MKNNVFCAILVAIAFTIITGCHHNQPMTQNHTTPPTITPPPSPSAALTITPDTVDRGQTAELTWKTENASTITIEGIGTVSASGSKTVTPASSTTYHLTATGQGGSADANARITVNLPAEKVSTLTDEQLFAQNVKDVFFGYDNFEIRDNELQVVNTDAAFLKQHPNMSLVIEGHCDERGSEAYNMGLGENRASTVKDTLVKQGISADRIKIISYGKEKPFCTAAEDESCWEKNRRAHFAFSN
jgi:peptidoglycan-associated lipoprotein